FTGRVGEAGEHEDEEDDAHDAAPRLIDRTSITATAMPTRCIPTCAHRSA
ncbi:MAG: hypothetical protein ACI9U2_004102, partial [Bradymonadia bacterium]